MNQRKDFTAGFLAALLLLGLALVPSARAQWLTQTIQLTNGWNAVYLHVDATHVALEDTVATDVNNPILEIWRWNPGTSMQFVTSPQEPIDGGSQWMVWKRDQVSAFHRLSANAAYLVRVATNVSTYAWQVQGKPVAPANDWTTTGLNFVGFPTVPSGAPTFETFLTAAPELQQNAEIYYYRGDDLGPGNPAKMIAFRNARVNRGQAYWMRSGTLFNEYFAPFKLSLQAGGHVDFDSGRSVASFRLKNLTSQALTVSITLINSETPPSGAPVIAALPPLLIRGQMNPTNLTYSYTNLPANSPRTWTLTAKGTPGSEIEVMLGLNRSAITSPAGSLLAGVLRFGDSLGFSQIDASVTAIAGTTAGLWVGNANVGFVSQYIKTYQLNGEDKPIITTNGQYVVTRLNTDLTATTRPFPLRLIVHNPPSGDASLFQRIFVGYDSATNFISANKETALAPALLTKARRISASHLPWSEANEPWEFTGRIGTDTNLSATVVVNHNDRASNPFLHSYHPDHDNLDATFKRELGPGAESFSIQRDITLQILPPTNDFASLTSGGQTVRGIYFETFILSGLPRAGNTHDTREFQAQGTFTLNRISESPTLTLQP